MIKSEEVLLLKFRLKTFSAFAVLVVGAVLLFGIWVFASMIFDGIQDWKVLLLVGLLIAVLSAFSFLVPWSIHFSSTTIEVRYLIGRIAKYDLHDLTSWDWRTNTAGNSGVLLQFKTGDRLVIPPVFFDDRLPSILNRHTAAMHSVKPKPTNESPRE